MSAHIEKLAAAALVKNAGIWKDMIARGKGLFRQAPLFGDDVAARAREHGVVTSWWGHKELEPFYRRLLKTFGKGDRVKMLAVKPNENIKNRLSKGDESKAMIDFGGVFKEHPLGYNGKLGEAEKFGDLLPKTVGIRDIMGEAIKLEPRLDVAATAKLPLWQRMAGKKVYREPRWFEKSEAYHTREWTEDEAAAILAAAQRRLGKNVIFKPDLGAQTIGASLPTEKTSPADLLKTLKGGVERGNAARSLMGDGIDKWVVQERFDLAKASYLDRLLNGLTTLTINPKTRALSAAKDEGYGTLWDNLGRAIRGKSVPGAMSSTGNNMKEYRVHVINGQVVPYATVFRGGVRNLLPWRTRDAAKAENYIKSVIDRFPASERNRNFGLDVAKNRSGAWHIIETNPTVSGGSSGMAHLPQVQDAFIAAAQGKLPRYLLAQRGIEGSVLGGGGYLAGNALLGGDTPQPEPTV